MDFTALNMLRNAIIGDEVYSHEDTDVSPPIMRHFNATRIRQYVENTKIDGKHWPVHTYQTDRALYLAVLRHCGAEEPKIKRLMERPDIYSQPALVAHFDGHTKQRIIDGTHRVIILYRMGLREFKAYDVPEFVWENFLVNLPTEDDPDFKDYCLGRGKYAR